ncbi:MAG: ThiF family adenylyltransferase, partial [Propionibacteriaceae bacterium]|nr:ThiF family adenylyltransferase [Propionibacteriaceae bacterium]
MVAASISAHGQAADDGRYDRQVALTGFGPANQARLARTTVLVVGAGGLGSPVIALLAGAGLGRLTIVDPDVVSRSNLHRQSLYTTADSGAPKAQLAAARARAINPDCVVQGQVRGFVAADVAAADIVVDCTDQTALRYAINRAALAVGKPVVWAAVAGWHGRLSVSQPVTGPCW